MSFCNLGRLTTVLPKSTCLGISLSFPKTARWHVPAILCGSLYNQIHCFSNTTTQLTKYNILYFGTDDFSVTCLEAILKKRDSIIKSIQVVTPPDNINAKLTRNREVPLKQFCKSSNIVCEDAPPKTLSGWQLPSPINGDSFDIAIVVSFGYFLPKRIIQSFSKAAINVHPSLLPKYRGASPIQHAIINGDEETGVSIIELSAEKFDAGRILKQSHTKVSPGTFFDDLHTKLAIQGGQDLADTIEHLAHYQRQAKVQDESLVTHAPRFDKSAANVRWHEHTAEHIYTMHRAIGSRIPLTTLFRGKLCQNSISTNADKTRPTRSGLSQWLSKS
ncbi:hypothetical protein BASA50_000223 [Batrachochytrium salamandrivorans]|uniref:methionyl-tRNA formyltransferase n=1 Tax=Batrachochytrium salamandrivorans TaxID=1357716 RepID=A0ABQ8EVM9_9FUNG|nr:hypothetical protein BASA60_003808 [Batrachochytrium salamandrivorans]KAH6583661.1 hypothetical protein BASA61_007887 [Batrachochytrium salamandrivorans]KAH6586859.1 hypothetical protein BASA50_000223 [Batrachochytrium salamandrivorans]